MNKYSRLRAVIDLDAIMDNVVHMHDNLNDNTKMMAVIKADAYGHGAVKVAQTLEDADYIWGFGVAVLEEGVKLRKAGIKKPILCLGCIFPEQMEDMIRYKIRMTVYSEELAQIAADKAKEINQKAIFHIKLDTGMSRLGFQINEESIEKICSIAENEYIELEGLFTHFAKADELDKTVTQTQMFRYTWMKEQLEAKGIVFPYYHCSNSAAIIDMPDIPLNLVRAGISIYGLYPSEEVKKENVSLRPALSLIAHVTFVKWIDKGTEVSYGGTYTTDKKTRVATVPVGYGDGYPRTLSNCGYVLIRGKRAPIIGRVCMDQFMVDVTDIPGVKFGDEVTLIGHNGNEFIPVEVLSEMADRFNYEFVCDINKRVPREYIRNGKIIDQLDSF